MNAIRQAYRAAYRTGEICREVGTLPDMRGVECIIDEMYEAEILIRGVPVQQYDMTDRDMAQFAYECGLCDGYRGSEPMSDVQIDIHFD